MEVAAVADGANPGSYAATLPQRFDGAFELYTFHGSHSRVVFRAQSLAAGAGDDGDDEDLDDRPLTFDTVDVAFIGARTMLLDVDVPYGMSIRVADPAADDVPPEALPDAGERVFLIDADGARRWVVGTEVWWTRATLPQHAPSPLLADLNLTVGGPRFSWAASGWTVYHA
jgi:hypothetical protein